MSRAGGASGESAGSEDDRKAFDRLFEEVYTELKRIAERELRKERKDHTLSPTALVHELYLRFVDQGRVTAYRRTQFLKVAGREMWCILVDHARARRREKRGGGRHKVPIEKVSIVAEPFFVSLPRGVEILDFDDCLKRLAESDPLDAKVVELRFLSGLTVPEVAAELGISERTVGRRWNHAKTELDRELSKGDTSKQ